MGDIVVLASSVNVTSAMADSGVYRQPLKDVMDISGVGRIDLQAVLNWMKGTSPTGITVTLYTSMQKETEDDSGWVAVGDVTLSGSAGTPEWDEVIVTYDATHVLFRYLRWKVTLLSGTTSATFSLSGIARAL